MITVFKTVWKIFQDQFEEQESVNFERGFETCYKLFKVGYEKTPVFNPSIQLLEKEKEIDKLKKIIAERERDINRHTRELTEANLKITKQHNYILDKDAAYNRLKEKQEIRINEEEIRQFKIALKDELNNSERLHFYSIVYGTRSGDEKVVQLRSAMQDWDLIKQFNMQGARSDITKMIPKVKLQNRRRDKRHKNKF